MQTLEIENSSPYPDSLPHPAAAGPTAANPGRLEELTKREREVLSLLAQGLTDRAISQNLWLTRMSSSALPASAVSAPPIAANSAAALIRPAK